MPIKLEWRCIRLGRRRWHLMPGDASGNRSQQHTGRRPLIGNDPADDRSEQDRDIGPCLNQPGSAQHIVLAEMLGQDRVFDRAEKG